MRQLLLGAVFLPAFTFAAMADEVTVFAAASLKGALDEVAADFTEKTGHAVVISYAGSNALAKQIIEGAPADLFISASEPWMDAVETAGAVAENGRIDLLGNRLVMVGHGADAPAVDLGQGFDLKGLLGEEHLAMALVDSVPAGQYGKAALEHLGLWDAIAPQVAQSDNVRATLALVAQGEAPYGIVYATDAAASPDVRIVATFPEESHPAITYPAALLGTGENAAARAFFTALSDEDADEIFRSAGFSVK